MKSQPSASALPRRLYTKLLLGLFVATAALSLSLLALGLQEPSSTRYLLASGIVIAVGSICWEFVERRVRTRTAGTGLVVWIALPLSIALGFAAIPLLLLAAHPPLASFLKRSGQVSARIVEDPDGERSLILRFPAPVRSGGFNLTLDGRAIPAAVGEDETVTTWRNPRTVLLRLQPLLDRVAGPPPRRVGVNLLPDAPKFALDETGDTVAPQQVIVRGEP